MNEQAKEQAGSTAGPGTQGRHKRRLGIVTLLLAGGIAGAGVATAVGVAAYSGGSHGAHAGMLEDGGHGRHGGRHGGHGGERMKDRVAWVLGAVDATPEQRDKVQSLLDDMFTQMREMRGERGELRRALITELAGADIDRDELERIRGEFVAGVETRSTTMVESLASVAETLTAEQRATIAEHMASRGKRH